MGAADLPGSVASFTVNINVTTAYRIYDLGGLTLPTSMLAAASAGRVRLSIAEAGSTGVHYDFAQTGAVGVELVIGLMHRQERGIPGRPQEVLLEGAWIEGSTLGPAPRV